MITTDGKLHIKRFLAGQVPAIAQSIAFGVGNKAEAVGDTKLQFEAGRVDIALTSFDFVNNRLIYKAQLPDDFSGSIYEAAIFSTSADDVAGQFGSRLLASFESDTEDWLDPSTGTAPTYVTGGTSRIGTASMRQAPAASASETDAMNQLALDLSGYSGNDKFVFAFNVGNANTASIRFRFMTDASNYYDILLGAQSSGYKVVEVAKSAATVTGAPKWESITEIRVITTSTAGGASAVDFDGIRIEDSDTINPNYVMVAREMLATPFIKEEGKIQEIEFALDVNV